MSSFRARLGNSLSFEKAGVKPENLKAYADSVVELRFLNVVLLWLLIKGIAMNFLLV